MKVWLLLMSLFISVSAFAFSGDVLVKDARTQIGRTVMYDPAYTALSYPMGDVPIQKGVCTDVVVRALRHQGMDLQSLIHQDMKKNFSAYPKKWGLTHPDKNIDHRRVPNIATYFKRKGYAINSTHRPHEFHAGDIVTWDLPKGLVHIGIVSDKKTATGVPLIIHNIGAGTKEEDLLYRFKITGHYRVR